MTVVLTEEEAKEVLSYLGHITVATLKAKPLLNEAVQKLLGNSSVPSVPYAACGTALPRDVLRPFCTYKIYVEGKINAIKLIHVLSGMSLVDAKHYCDANYYSCDRSYVVYGTTRTQYELDDMVINAGFATPPSTLITVSEEGA